jgi:glycosyltransferase involved in cell wall biosynthesis
MTPKVSVVVPSYNHGRYLAARLDSVLGQTFPDFEVIFLDDASPDDSLAVFEKYRRHPKVRAIVNETNSGCVFRQWNKGVRAARGEYVWIAESDDVADPRFLEVLVGLLDANPTAGLAYCKSLSIDETGRVLGEVDPWTRPFDPARWDADFTTSGRDECRRYLSHRNTIPNASAVLLRKGVYEAVGYANETMRLLGDWEMWVRVLLASDLAYSARPLNLYRHTHDQSVRRTSLKEPVHLKNYLQVVKLILPHGPLPPEAWQGVLDTAAWYWGLHAWHADGFGDRAVHLDALRAAREIDPELAWAIVAGVAAQVGQTHAEHRNLHKFTLDLHQAANDLYAARVQLEARLAAAEATIAELARQVRFWDRVRRVLLPSGGWRHRLLKKAARAVRPKKAA